MGDEQINRLFIYSNVMRSLLKNMHCMCVTMLHQYSVVNKMGIV